MNNNSYSKSWKKKGRKLHFTEKPIIYWIVYDVKKFDFTM